MRQFALIILLLLIVGQPVSTRPIKLNHDQTGLYRFQSFQLPFMGGLECDACKAIMDIVDQLLEKNTTEDVILDVMVEFCKVGEIETPRVCEYIAREFKDELFGVLTGHYATPDEICGMLVGSSCDVPYNPNTPWNVTFPKVAKPPVTIPKPPKAGSPKLTILHLSDLHWDRMYQEGAEVECGEPLCCRSNDKKPAKGKPAAGKWGDYRGCDTPTRVFENLLQTVAKQHKIDFVYLTGDLPAHDVWNQTREDQTSIINQTTAMFQTYLPGIPVYPAVGNHESSPVNSFPPPFITGHNSITWLYQSMVDSWVTEAKWLPKNTTSTLIKGGYYSVRLYNGLILVSLNMNMCNDQNWWLLENEDDPAEELQWLIGVLQKAEDNHDHVHILGHIPPGSGDCFKQWSENYNKIVNRYESTIRGQFFGHTHKDSFEIFFEPKTKRPTSMLYNGGSVTTYSYVNPNYRTYEVDGNYKNSSWAVLDHETYVMNLTDANLTDNPKWNLEYTAKAAYGMKALQAVDWNELVGKFEAVNSTLFDQFYKYYYKSHVTQPCDAQCKTNFICDLKTACSGSKEFC
ncbi:sphingomyelin phosphodiesterase-like isoform X2 [Patiria miniata]|nr:sphingomyelin phosphodiesterase-like isoform X2 [Patiria miniata]XP_038051986.1 sphingomyelin phosphodiesterase-like isoform X2 [Patiria miniata]XP_038051987.1 sphingomyelin phosphodiesterase-like isoform X2 [Patiria miniata]